VICDDRGWLVTMLAAVELSIAHHSVQPCHASTILYSSRYAYPWLQLLWCMQNCCALVTSPGVGLQMPAPKRC